MIIIRAADEAAVFAQLEKVLQESEVDIYQSDDTEMTTEEWLGVLAFNAYKTRTYIGRLERNTRQIGDSLRALVRMGDPVSKVFGMTLEELEAAQEGEEEDDSSTAS